MEKTAFLFFFTKVDKGYEKHITENKVQWDTMINLKLK